MTQIDPDLPDELQVQDDARPDDAEAQYRHLQSVGSLIATKRDAAVKARKESGIEDIWTAAEEAYAGIDDNNRAQSGGSQQWRKPTSPNGPLTRGTGKADETRSTAYVRLTTRYVDMAAAKVKEKALPIDDKPFGLKPTPVPEPVAGDIDPSTDQDPAAPAAAMAQPPVSPMAGGGGAAAQPPSQPTPVAAAANQAVKPSSAAEKAADRIYDWWIESDYPSHIRKVIDDSARIGVGVMKGPFPTNRRDKAFSVKEGKGELTIVETTQPGVTWVDPWNCFPAGNCGENIHDGDHFLERGYLSEAKLLALKSQRGLLGEPIYLSEQIDKVIHEGPDKCNVSQDGRKPEDKKNLYTVWYFTGQMSRDDMIALRAVGAEDLPDEVLDCYALVTLVNDTVIQAQFNPLEKSGHFPYRTFPWARRAGSWAGVGVGEQVTLPQSMVNAGTRAWMNNAGVSSGAQVLWDQSKIYPMDGSAVIGGGIKLWSTLPEAQNVDLRQAMATFEIPNMGDELKAIIDYAFKLAEELSNIPLVSQGQTGPTDPQTFGQAELQNSNANTLLRQIADTLDGNLIAPMVDDFYEWLLLDPDVPDDEKGDFDIIASGCSAMVEKAIQEQVMMALGQMTLNPAYEMSPARWAEQMLRSRRLEPELLKYTPEELQKLQSQPPPEAPQVTVAKINAGTKLHTVEMQGQQELQRIAQESAHEQQLLQAGGATPHMANATARIESTRIKAESDQNIQASRAAAEQAYVEAESQMARDNANAKMQELAMTRELAILQYANTQKVTLDQVKADLAKTAMVEQTKRELAAVNHQATATEMATNHAHEAQQNQADRIHEAEQNAALQKAADKTGNPETAPT